MAVRAFGWLASAGCVYPNRSSHLYHHGRNTSNRIKKRIYNNRPIAVSGAVYHVVGKWHHHEDERSTGFGVITKTPYGKIFPYGAGSDRRVVLD